MSQIIIRRMEESEREAALQLAWEVFSEFESPVYPEEGTASFWKALHDESYLAGLKYYGAFAGDILAGITAIREETQHICFFFVDGKYQRRGIGTKLFECVREDFPDRNITLNAAPAGLAFYRHLGFAETDSEQTIDGITFTPMVYLNEGE